MNTIRNTLMAVMVTYALGCTVQDRTPAEIARSEAQKKEYARRDSIFYAKQARIDTLSIIVRQDPTHDGYGGYVTGEASDGSYKTLIFIGESDGSRVASVLTSSDRLVFIIPKDSEVGRADSSSTHYNFYNLGARSQLDYLLTVNGQPFPK
jgi:hypothetical protein